MPWSFATYPRRQQRGQEKDRQRLQQSFGARVSGVLVPSVARVQNQYLREIRLRIEASASIARAKTLLMEHIRYTLAQPECKGTTIIPDVDPL